MNTNIVKNVVILIGGLGIGTLATSLILKKKYEAIVSEEIKTAMIDLKGNYERKAFQEINDAIRNMQSKHPKGDSGIFEEISAVISDIRIAQQNLCATREAPLTEREKMLAMSGDRYRRETRRYGSEEISSSLTDRRGTDRVDDKIYHECEEISDKVNFHPSDRPYVISLEEFSEEMDNFDKLTIYYYTGDDTLVDEGETVISDIDMAIGQDNITGCLNEGLEVLYVRNERMAIDYEVVCLFKSFEDIALPVEKKIRKKRTSTVRRSEEDESWEKNKTDS